MEDLEELRRGDFIKTATHARSENLGLGLVGLAQTQGQELGHERLHRRVMAEQLPKNVSGDGQHPGALGDDNSGNREIGAKIAHLAADLPRPQGGEMNADILHTKLPGNENIEVEISFPLADERRPAVNGDLPHLAKQSLAFRLREETEQRNVLQHRVNLRLRPGSEGRRRPLPCPRCATFFGRQQGELDQAATTAAIIDFMAVLFEVLRMLLQKTEQQLGHVSYEDETDLLALRAGEGLLGEQKTLPLAVQRAVLFRDDMKDSVQRVHCQQAENERRVAGREADCHRPRRSHHDKCNTPRKIHCHEQMS